MTWRLSSWWLRFCDDTIQFLLSPNDNKTKAALIWFAKFTQVMTAGLISRPWNLSNWLRLKFWSEVFGKEDEASSIQLMQKSNINDHTIHSSINDDFVALHKLLRFWQSIHFNFDVISMFQSILSPSYFSNDSKIKSLSLHYLWPLFSKVSIHYTRTRYFWSSNNFDM